jgi:hypothetical protein
VFQGELYIGGYFQKSNGNIGDYIQKWNGSVWSEVGGGTGGANGSIMDFEIFQNKLYAVGTLEEAGGQTTQYIASWDGTDWCVSSTAFDNVVQELCVYKDSLCIGGGFNNIDGVGIRNVSMCNDPMYLSPCGHINSIIEEFESTQQLSIFPNPAEKEIVCTSSEPLLGYTLTVYDMLGRKLLAKSSEKSSLLDEVIDISSLPGGAYFVQLVSKTFSAGQKVIKN